MNGAVKLMEAAFASSRCLTPLKNMNVDISRMIERRHCHFGWVVRTSGTMPKRGANSTRMKTRCESTRAQTICSEG